MIQSIFFSKLFTDDGDQFLFANFDRFRHHVPFLVAELLLKLIFFSEIMVGLLLHNNDVLTTSVAGSH